MVEHGGKGIGLIGKRRVCGKVAAQIAEARWRNNPVPEPLHRLSETQPLIETATRAVDHQQWRTGTRDGIF
jgi:hypothetical protein